MPLFAIPKCAYCGKETTHGEDIPFKSSRDLSFFFCYDHCESAKEYCETHSPFQTVRIMKSKYCEDYNPTNNF